MSESETPQHSEWECKYHVIFVPKSRWKVLYGTIRRHLGELFRRLARPKEREIEDGHMMEDHGAAGVYPGRSTEQVATDVALPLVHGRADASRA